MIQVGPSTVVGGSGDVVLTPADQRINAHQPPRTATRRTLRHTPYQKTPGSRILCDTAARTPFTRRANDADVVPESVTELLTKTWRLYKVSPLYKFNYSKLRQYQKLLASHVHVETKKVAVGLSNLDEETANAASFTKLEGFRVHEDDPDAVRILLQQKKPKVREPQTVLTAVLCCVGGGDDQSQPDFTYMPLMLVKGPIGLTRIMHSWMETMFDCYISAVAFSPTSLTWMLSMWAGYLPDRADRGRSSSKRVDLMYTVPSSVPELSTITLSIDAKQCQQLWAAVRPHKPRQPHVFTAEEVVAFMKSIEHHFYHHFRIHLRPMKLSRVGTSTAYVGNEGKLKIFSKTHAKQVLGLLTELVIEQSWV